SICPLAGPAEDGDEPGDVGARVRDEGLRAVDHPLVSVENRAGPWVTRVGAAARLGEAERGERLAGAQLRKPLLLLLRGAEPEDGHRPETDRRFESDGDARVRAGELLDRKAQGQEVTAHAAVLLRERQPEQTHPAHLRNDVVGELAGLVVVRGTRRHDLLRELFDRLAQCLVLVVEPEVHGPECPTAAITPPTTIKPRDRP